MRELRGKVAVVTGAASGIGLGMARAFGAEGMKVVLADIEQVALERAAEGLRAAGHEALAVRTDVSSLSDTLAHGMDPDEVGPMIVDAMREHRFWVLTHPGMARYVQSQLEAMVGDRSLTRA